MPTFKDRNGKEWTLKLDAPIIREVRKTCKLDLADITGAFYEQLLGDEVLLVDVLWVICRPQANGTSDTQFGEALVGESIAQAVVALKGAIHDFFPAWKREALEKVMEASDEMRTQQIQMTLDRMKDPANLKAFEEAMKKRFENYLTQFSSVTSSPESSGSVPTG